MSIREKAARERSSRSHFCRKANFSSGTIFGLSIPLSGISRVNHELRLADDALIVVVGVVGDDQHAIILAQIVQGSAFHLQVVLAAFSHRGEKGIVVADLRLPVVAAVR